MIRNFLFIGLMYDRFDKIYALELLNVSFCLFIFKRNENYSPIRSLLFKKSYIFVFQWGIDDLVEGAFKTASLSDEDKQDLLTRH